MNNSGIDYWTGRPAQSQLIDSSTLKGIAKAIYFFINYFLYFVHLLIVLFLHFSIPSFIFLLFYRFFFYSTPMTPYTSTVHTRAVAKRQQLCVCVCVSSQSI